MQCASYQDELKEIKGHFYGSRYNQALEALEKSALARSDRSRLLYLLEKSQILQNMGEGKEARKLLLEADKLVDKLYTVSVSKEAATYLFNESAQDYGGEIMKRLPFTTC